MSINISSTEPARDPFAHYDDPIVEAAIDQRRKFFEAKRDHLYQVEIFYCIVLEGAGPRPASVLHSLACSAIRLARLTS